MRRYSLLLDECLIDYVRCTPCEDIGKALEKLFDFDYGMPKDYKYLFEYTFFLHYRYHNINFDSFKMFKNQLHVKLLELMPKYRKLYASQDIINNPFVNQLSSNDTYTRQRGRNKSFGVDNSRAFNLSNDNTGGISVSRTGIIDGNSSANIGSGELIEKNKDMSDSRQWELNKYTDSPQSKQENEDSFNDGYITTKSRQDERQAKIDSGEKENWRKDVSQSTNNGFSNTESYSDNINQHEEIGHKETYADKYEVNALQNTHKRIQQIYGLSGVTVSAIVQEWRDTFISVDKMLIEELKPLFILVY